MNRLERETIKRYNEIAEEYSRSWRGATDEEQLKVMRRFEDLIGLPPKTILDAGCGTGKHASYFAHQGYQIVGVDLSSEMLRQAIKNSQLQKTTIDPVIANMKLLGFKDKAVDGIWSVASIVHLSPEDKKGTIQQFYRVLKHGGVIHVGVQNLLTPKHLKRVGQSYFCYLGYDENDKFYLEPKNPREIIADQSLIDRLKLGYAFLDNRHWFYPTKVMLLKLLTETGFFIIESNHPFSRRLNIFATKQ